jgi:uncharacterized protein (DUF2249 family)
MDRKDAKVVELDVRPMLQKKLEPFQLIMDTVKKLGKDDIFVLHATFRPTPLFGVMKLKGYAGKAEQAGREHWIATFVHKKNKHWLDETGTSVETAVDAEQDAPDSLPREDGPATVKLDNRGLEPPQPMVRTLSTLVRCRPGDEVVIHNDRVPVFLLEELKRLGYPHKIEEQPDGSAIVTIRKT